ncbi:MAG: Endonuclease/Exonuclease/phosphatase family protein [Candidatus Hydrogenedentes bacterium ADurb.Bin170]|nr:MAG: Endonuclease/Exonuclease/phosphatase family protein [Candidatus Hydrogenedentes bacterium ADurb.Bin170]
MTEDRTEEKKKNALQQSTSTCFFALLLLFFFQLFGRWIESIYRLSLIKLEPGYEIFGLFLFLAAGLLWLIPRRWDRKTLRFCLVFFFLCRLLTPFLSTPGQVLLSGMGVAVWLIIYAFLLSRQYCSIQGDGGSGLALAVLILVLLRSAGNSIDLSMHIRPFLLGVPLTGADLLLSHRVLASLPESGAPDELPAYPGNTLALLSLFGNYALISLFFSCPLAVCCWHGYHSLFLTGLLFPGISLLSFTLFFLLQKQACFSEQFRKNGLLWNALFLLLLMSGLIVGRPPLPQSPSDAAVILPGATLSGQPLLLFALFLSPVIVLNMRRAQAVMSFADPRQASLRIFPGFLLLLSVSLLLILTNVWGYVPGGEWLRNRFYLPFLPAGTALFILWLKKSTHRPNALRQTLMYRAALSFLVLFLLMQAWQGYRRAGHAPGHENRMTVMTYNIQQGSEQDGTIGYQAQLKVLKHCDADVVALQESDTARPSGGMADPVRYFASSLGYNACYGPGSIIGSYGTALLSRYPIRSPQIRLTYSTVDEVATLSAELDVNGGHVFVSSNHPAGPHEVMSAHAENLAASGSEYRHAIALGDFNFTRKSPYYERVHQSYPVSAEEKADLSDPENPEQQRDKIIDHIFASASFEVLESYFLSPPASKSDHPVHWAVLQRGAD